MLVCGSYELNKKNIKCNIPSVIRGSWYSWENGHSTTTIFDAKSMTNRGNCIRSMEENHVNFTFVFLKDNCYTCVKIMVRTVNVIEKVESKSFKNDQSKLKYQISNFKNISGVCMSLNPNEVESNDKICQFQDTQLHTLFSENYIPVNCRSSLEGVWQFAYQVY